MTRGVEARGRNFNERHRNRYSRNVREAADPTSDDTPPPRISSLSRAFPASRSAGRTTRVMDEKQLTTAALARYEGGIRIIL